MKTIEGHIVRMEVPVSARSRAPFFLAWGNATRNFARSWRMVAPFMPLRQPVGGHGNPRKEHPLPRDTERK